MKNDIKQIAEHINEKGVYCSKCGTLKKIYLENLGLMPKMCKCECEKNGIEWVPDDKIK